MNRHLYDEEALMKDYPLAARTAHPEGTVIPVGSAALGGENLTLIAGPCAVESREQLFATAAAVKAAGATILRGGTYKPRTSPYAFAGLGEEGLRLLAEAGREFQLPTVSEITDAALLPQFEEIDILQVGARNMQNYTLLQALGRQPKPVLLKRGLPPPTKNGLPRPNTSCGREIPMSFSVNGASAATKAAPAPPWIWPPFR